MAEDYQPYDNKEVKDGKKMEIDGHGVRIGCGDGTVLDYHASDGGYSLWHVTLPNGRVVG